MGYFCKKCDSFYSVKKQELTCNCQEPVVVKEFHAERVPVFQQQAEGVNEFSINNAAEIHDNAMAWLHAVHGTDEETFRRSLVSKLDNVSGSVPNILVTSAGAGNDIRYIAERFPQANLYVQDIAAEMLSAAIERNSNVVPGVKIFFFVGDALDLPFQDGFFDIVFHFGGINLFSDRQAGLLEAHRVVKIGGQCLYGDEGLAPWMYKSDIAKALIENNNLYSCGPPLDLLPEDISSFSLTYFFNNCFFVFTYKKSGGVSINIDVPHVGRRGGTIRTRYFGKLEGIDPVLRDEFYKYAERKGVSRVNLLEQMMRDTLGNE